MFIVLIIADLQREYNHFCVVVSKYKSLSMVAYIREMW